MSTESKDYWMRRAIDLARYCHTPYAAIITDSDGKLVAQKAETVKNDFDPTARAEINAIRKSCKAKKTLQLNGCMVFCTVEPSPLSGSAIASCDIRSITFGTSIPEAIELGENQPNLALSDFFKSIGYEADITPGFLKEECTGLIKQFSGK